MTHNCFISFKKEDTYYRDKIIEKLDDDQIQGKSLDMWIDSDDIEYIMQRIRTQYIQNTSVTLFLIGEHSSENEGYEYDEEKQCFYNKQSFIIRELKASLYDGKNNRRSGLLGIVLPEMYDKIYGKTEICETCNKEVKIMNINPTTVIKEFSENYYLNSDSCGHYKEENRFCVLVKYHDFIKNPNIYIDKAYDKLNKPISQYVHWKDIDHKYYY